MHRIHALIRQPFLPGCYTDYNVGFRARCQGLPRMTQHCPWAWGWLAADNIPKRVRPDALAKLVEPLA